MHISLWIEEISNSVAALFRNDKELKKAIKDLRKEVEELRDRITSLETRQ